MKRNIGKFVCIGVVFVSCGMGQNSKAKRIFHEVY